MASELAHEKVWIEKPSYDKAERLHFERLAKVVAAKILEQRDDPNPKSLVTFVAEEPAAVIATNEISWVGVKQSENKTSKSGKKHRNKKKIDNVINLKDPKPVVQENQPSTCPIIPASGSLANEIAKARQHIKKSLQCMNGIAAGTDVSLQDVVARVACLEKDNQELRTSVQQLKETVKVLETKLATNSFPSLQICPAKPAPAVPATAAKADAGEDDVDLFGSDSEGEDAEAAKIREERLAAYAAKKSKKPVLIAKSNIILDVKPWDDETDMAVMETEVRKITCDGLLWGAAKLVPLAYGIHKLQISCVVEDDKVSVDWLTEAIQEIEDYVQSVDIAAFNKV